jgi:hypothetical protein
MRAATGLVSLFATCALPGCPNPVVEWGQVCPDCVTACGPYLQPTRPDQPAITEAVLAERDLEVATAMRLLRGVACGGRDATQIRKQNQRCWLCEERHTCTQTGQGWECDRCRAIE